MPARLEHANLTVSDAAETARWMAELFGWRIRWQGPVSLGGHTVHIGSEDQYLALYQPPEPTQPPSDDRRRRGRLNHVGVVTQDLAAIEERVRALGFEPCNHADYEPGRRFYFHDRDGIEYEVVEYDDA